jgi:hypothetical protein
MVTTANNCVAFLAISIIVGQYAFMGGFDRVVLLVVVMIVTSDVGKVGDVLMLLVITGVGSSFPLVRSVIGVAHP